jgi:foldase protein PrsA
MVLNLCCLKAGKDESKAMKKINLISFIILINIFTFAHAGAWELYDRVIATVNETPVIESELTKKFERISERQKIAPKKMQAEKSRLLDKFIDEAIVEQTAKEQSIMVTSEKVDNQIKKIMERMNIKSIDVFKKEIEKLERIPYEDYKEEMRKSLVAEQVMSIAIGVSPPSTREAEEWYKVNKDKIGYEVNIQQIMIKLKNDSFEENKKVSKAAQDVLAKIKSGMAFENAAREVSEDAATKNIGGSMGWVPLSNMARRDIDFANNIYNSFVMNNKKIDVIKSGTAYHIVKYNGKRPTAFEAVKDEIFNVLYQKKVMEQFNKWVSRKKQESDIKIYLSDYIKEQVSG